MSGITAIACCCPSAPTKATSCSGFVTDRPAQTLTITYTVTPRARCPVISYTDVPWLLCYDTTQARMICYNPPGCTPYGPIVGGLSRKAEPVWSNDWGAPTAVNLGRTSFLDATGCTQCNLSNYRTVAQSTTLQTFGATLTGSFTITHPCGGINSVPYVYTDGDLTFYVTWTCCDSCVCDSSTYVCSTVSISAEYTPNVTLSGNFYLRYDQGCGDDPSNPYDVSLKSQTGSIYYSHTQQINITLERNIFTTQLPYDELSPGAYTVMSGQSVNDFGKAYDWFGPYDGYLPCHPGNDPIVYSQSFNCDDITSLRSAGWDLTVTAT
jgi:hypothetical protein